LGAKEVPTLTSLQKTQAEFMSQMGDPTTKKTSCHGNVYYINEIGAALVKVSVLLRHSLAFTLTICLLFLKDMSNPLTRPHMVFYPEDAGHEASQTWHGERWLKTAPDVVLTPMMKHPVTGQHYYVGELVKCVDKPWFIPKCWFRKKGVGM
jgi:hypothetical protein